MNVAKVVVFQTPVITTVSALGRASYGSALTCVTFVLPWRATLLLRKKGLLSLYIRGEAR